MEKLALQINGLVDRDIWQPLTLSRQGLSLSYLFFADDVLLFCKAWRELMQLVASTIENFYRESSHGLKVYYRELLLRTRMLLQAFLVSAMQTIYW